MLNQVIKLRGAAASVFASLLLGLTSNVPAQHHDRSLCPYLDNSTAILIGRFASQAVSDGKAANPREERIAVIHAIKGISGGARQLSVENESYSAAWNSGQDYLIFLWDGKGSYKFRLASAFPVFFVNHGSDTDNSSPKFLISFGDFFTADKTFLDSVKVSVFTGNSRYSLKTTHDGIFAVGLVPGGKADVLVEGPKTSLAWTVGDRPPQISYDSDKTRIRYSLEAGQIPCRYQQFYFASREK